MIANPITTTMLGAEITNESSTFSPDWLRIKAFTTLKAPPNPNIPATSPTGIPTAPYTPASKNTLFASFRNRNRKAIIN